MAEDLERERRFYDQTYAQHLAADDGALAVNRDILLAQFHNPASPYFERRLLYQTAWEALMAEPLAGRKALDYGCGGGEWGVTLATEGAEAALVDLSPVAIELGLRRARASGVADHVRGDARDATDLSCFADEEFDLVFACAAVHHTIKYGPAFDELLRILKPGGRLVLAEGWGNNPLLNAARRLRWLFSGETAGAGEGVIFSQQDADRLRQRMSRMELTPLNLFAMSKRLFRGRLHRPGVLRLLQRLEKIDRRLLDRWPGLGRYCGEVVVVAWK